MGWKDWWQDFSRDVAAYPRDENGDVLWGMHRRGDRLDQARDVDFFFIFPNEKPAEQFCAAAREQGWRVALCWFEEKHAWDATCTMHMKPTHTHVTQCEHSLSTMAQPFGGSPDGWGTMAQ
jgi:hypothetical protein